MNKRTNFHKNCIVCGKEFLGGCVAKYCKDCLYLPCIFCGKKIKVTGKRRNGFKYCSRRCFGKAVLCTPEVQAKITRHYGSNHPGWKGGRVLRKDGYILLEVHGQRFFEHRYVMEQFLGRKLETNETLHHINHDRSDNRLENLEIVSRSEHSHLYNVVDRGGSVTKNCLKCGKEFRSSKSNDRTYCSKECWYTRNK